MLLSGIYLGRGVAFTLFLLLPATPLTVLLFSASIGLLWLSTVPLTSGLVALMFGTRHVGMLFGIVFLSHQVGAFIGVWLGGGVYEATGAYEAMWVLCIALSLFAADHPPPDPRAAGDGGARREPGMSRRVRDLLLGVALTLVTFAGVAWQAGRRRPTARTATCRRSSARCTDAGLGARFRARAAYRAGHDPSNRRPSCWWRTTRSSAPSSPTT